MLGTKGQQVQGNYIEMKKRMNRDCVVENLTGSSPLMQTRMINFAPGRVVIEVAQRRRVKYEAKCAHIGYGFLPFSFSSFGELEKDAMTLLKRIRRFFVTQDIGARVAVHIFNMKCFAIARGLFWPNEDSRSMLVGVFSPNTAQPLHEVELLDGSASLDFNFSTARSALTRLVIASGRGCGDWQGRLATLPYALGAWRSSPLTQTEMVDFAQGHAVIDTSQFKRVNYEAKCADIGYGFPPFSFSSLGKLEKDAMNSKILHDSRH
ncbi:hypothetical protein Tco_0369107 [Tanacetum coccineum]